MRRLEPARSYSQREMLDGNIGICERVEAARRVAFAIMSLAWERSVGMAIEETAAPTADGETPIRVRPSREGDVQAMLAIYLHHIRNGVDPRYVGDIETPDADDIKRRRKSMQRRKMPHIVAEQAGVVFGYAYAAPFRKRPAYRFAVKHSIYVHNSHLHRGIGRLLMAALIDACAAAGFRQMIGYIDAANEASLAIHERFGFRRVGYLPQIGYKFGHWTDSVMVQRSLGLGSTAPPEG
jgi:L-amino acid N-acyltransferase YncA